MRPLIPCICMKHSQRHNNPDALTALTQSTHLVQSRSSEILVMLQLGFIWQRPSTPKIRPTISTQTKSTKAWNDYCGPPGTVWAPSRAGWSGSRVRSGCNAGTDPGNDRNDYSAWWHQKWPLLWRGVTEMWWDYQGGINNFKTNILFVSSWNPFYPREQR